MADTKYFIDDRIIIPDDIKNMTVDELEVAIERLEKELKIKRESA